MQAAQGGRVGSCLTSGVLQARVTPGFPVRVRIALAGTAGWGFLTLAGLKPALPLPGSSWCRGTLQLGLVFHG